MLFPPDFNYKSKGVDDTNVVIENGIIISGTLSKPQIGASKMSVIQALYNRTDGRRRAMMFVNDAMKVIDYYMTYISGFSVGISDLELTNKDVRDIVKSNQRKTDYIVSLIDKPTQDDASRKRREIEVVNTLQSNADSFGQKITKEAIPPQNPVRAMIRSKAKGDVFHLTSCVAQGGQQYELGKRLETNISGERGSVFDPPGVRTVESRGFIKESLGEGFNPRSQQSHHTASRVGLVDTSIKTSSAGEVHRLQNEFLMDAIVAQDRTLRDVNGIIISYVPGMIGLDSFHTVPVSYRGQKVGFFVDINSLVDDINSSLISW
jgi:DNA-directed RNA polymerase beta' subunit